MDRRTFVTVPLASTVLSALQTHAVAAPTRIDFKTNLPGPGSFPAKWICGSPSCMDNQDPPVQVHWYNEHTVFLRQNKAYSYEAPFMHLYFGNERILMLDQGFTQLSSDWRCARWWTIASTSGVIATGARRKIWNCCWLSAICIRTTSLRSTNSSIAQTRAPWG